MKHLYNNTKSDKSERLGTEKMNHENLKLSQQNFRTKKFVKILPNNKKIKEKGGEMN